MCEVGQRWIKIVGIYKDTLTWRDSIRVEVEKNNESNR
jgi:hypothetical protein